MKEELFIPISRTGEAVVRSRCAFESARAAYDDWYICDNGSLFFQRMNGEFFEIPQSRIGSHGLINEMLEMGDDFKFRNFMYAYLRVLHDKGISEATVKTEAYPDDNS